MKIEQGDLWQKHQEGYHICIPVNKETKSDLTAVMGAGLANEARLIFPELPKLLGEAIRRDSHSTGLFFRLPAYRLIMLGTKRNWRDPSDLESIRRSCERMAAAIGKPGANSLIDPAQYPVYLPKLGCGCGKLKWTDVAPVMQRALNDNFVVLI
ncbi:MAG: hypothetical protein EBU46_18540 [Nitrosomonadaceae bacterium]|nr:hypothetical protein [Nitrosomonadaceae bacterium]